MSLDLHTGTMFKRYVFLFIALFFATGVSAQMFILNEDFNSASGTTPPAGWTNITVTGNATDKWHFDNPGDRLLNYPVTEPFAVFDGDSISANGTPEEVVLESPLFDASTSNFILLNFAHVFDPGNASTARIMAYDGNNWLEVSSFSATTTNPASEIVDLSPYTGGVSNARIRFIWSGNGSGYWAIDNIRIYASLPLDGGIVSIDSPASPVTPGTQDIKITLGNFGYNNLVSTTINWSADGIMQLPHSWEGSIGFGQTESNITIGSYNFQKPVMIRVWQTAPNGQTDLNPYNDTVSAYLVPPLCGTYTIGGNSPDFESFSLVADVLNLAGITCPVTFLVRDGIYSDQFEIRNIQGASEVNTVTFRSESGDSTQAVIKIIPNALKYEPMIYLNGARYISFRQLGLSTGSASQNNHAIYMRNAKHISLEKCAFTARNEADLGVTIVEGCADIDIIDNYFETISGKARAIDVSGISTRGIAISKNNIKGATEKGYATIKIAEGAESIIIDQNQIERCFRAVYISGSDSITIIFNRINNCNDGIYADESSGHLLISSNRLTNIRSNQNVPEGNSGIFLKKSDSTEISNNFIQSTGSGNVSGIWLVNDSALVVCHNSINITSTEITGKSSGILLVNDKHIFSRNNIFRVKSSGIPVSISGDASWLDFDYNDYYHPDLLIGQYNDTPYKDLTSWSGAVGMDDNSLSVIPFFTSDSILTINQALLNNSGVPVEGLDYDIDGVLRDPVNPDIGAKEYTPCPADAGINAVTSPGNPLNGGTEQVTVQLQNQGTSILTQVTINWSVNGQVQPSIPWNGNLPEKANSLVQVGDYDFQPGILYIIKAWTSAPNSSTDCNPANDTVFSHQLAVPLCGNYTVGGTNPDFESLDDAVKLLNLAGVTCPVTIFLRDGIYYEKLMMSEFYGVSETNTVTFCSQSADSSKVTIRIPGSALKDEDMIYLDGARNIIFRDLGLFTGTTAATSYSNTAIVLDKAHDITFDNCYLEIKKDSDIGISIMEGCQDITVKNSRFESLNSRAVSLNAKGDLTRNLVITGNTFRGTTEYQYASIQLSNKVRQVNLSGNAIDNCFRGIYAVSCDSIIIRNNLITNTNEGIYINACLVSTEISGNRLLDIISHGNAPDGTSGINVSSSSNVKIFNNFILSSGIGPVTGINLTGTTNSSIDFNSLSITSQDSQGKSRGISLTGNSYNINARNNICSIRNTGFPVLINPSGIQQPQIIFDFNDYFGLDNIIGNYKGNIYHSLSEWRAATQMDQHSLSVVPFYSSTYDLSINQALLNDAGVPVTGIITDIDGASRPPSTPDIGAKEYNPCSSDAGINEIISPVSPLGGGNQEIRVILQNQGTLSLTSVKIYWSVNEEIQGPFSWNGNLGVKGNTEILLGNYNFLAGQSYFVKAWTSLPNNQQDCNNNNDTISSGELSGPLCGTYTIGGNDPDFESFTQVAELLNSAGITCPVTFLIRDGIYNEKFILNQVTGSSEINTITFRSESGDSTGVILQIPAGSVNYDAVIKLEGSLYVRFKGLKIVTANPSGNNYGILTKSVRDISFENCYFESKNNNDLGIYIQNGSQQVTINNCRFECIKSQTGAVNISGLETSDIIIEKNTITGAAEINGVYGNILVKTTNEVSNLTIKNNIINRSNTALSLASTNNILISNNIIENTHYGIYIYNGCRSVNILANRLIDVKSLLAAPDGVSGIYVQSTDSVDIINNFIHSSGQGPVIGINLQSDTTAHLYYNSVNITNTDAQGKSKGVNIKGSGTIASRNNILFIKSSGLPIHIDQDVSTLAIDYNNYYNPSGIIGKLVNQVYTNMTQWGLNINGDANSLSVHPYFKSDSVPLPYQRILNGSGIPIAGIRYDIDGKVRHIQAPDMGCMEFFVDFGVLEMLSPNLECYHADLEPVVVYLRQFGDVPFDSLQIAYQLNDGPKHFEKIDGPLEFDFVHQFSTSETIETYGDYLFKIWLVDNRDDNINNDLLQVWRYSKPSPVASIGYENTCTGPEVYFTGTATVDAPYYIDKYEWIFGDGDTSYIQNPVHLFRESGTYSVILRAYSNSGCYGYTNIQLDIDTTFQGLEMTHELSDETCYGSGSGNLTLSATGGHPPYSYFLNGEEVPGGFAGNLSSGNYEASVVDALDCSVSDSVTVYTMIHMLPVIIADRDTGYSPLTVHFDYQAINAASCTWFFPGNYTDTNKMTSYTFTGYGNDTVWLEVSSGEPYFCTETDSIIITVDIIVTIEPNSVFTPNGDGYNDFFLVKSFGLKEMDVKIFNQWGNRVYEITEVNGKWDGLTENGAEAADGTYFYELKAKGIDDLGYERKGTVLLLRHGAAVYPNPVTDNVNIKTYDALDSPVNISVYSLYGELVHSEVQDDPVNITLNLGHLSKGVYFIRINDDRKICSVRIIKN